MVGDRIASQGSLAVDLGRDLARALKRQWHASHRGAVHFVAGVDGAQHHLARLPSGAAKPHQPRFVARTLDNQIEAAGAAIADYAALSCGPEISHGRVSQNLRQCLVPTWGTPEGHTPRRSTELCGVIVYTLTDRRKARRTGVYEVRDVRLGYSKLGRVMESSFLRPIVALAQSLSP